MIFYSCHFPLSRVTYHFFRSSLSQNYIGKDFQRFPMFPKGLPIVSNVLSLGSLGYRDGEIKKGNEMQLSLIIPSAEKEKACSVPLLCLMHMYAN